MAAFAALLLQSHGDFPVAQTVAYWYAQDPEAARSVVPGAPAHHQVSVCELLARSLDTGGIRKGTVVSRDYQRASRARLIARAKTLEQERTLGRRRDTPRVCRQAGLRKIAPKPHSAEYRTAASDTAGERPSS